MVLYYGCSLLLLTFLALPGLLLGDLVFRCPNCAEERQAACPKLATTCTEIVREPSCGCCPVCSRLEGEFCGVYTPRCSTGLRCYPTADSERPLEQLVQGLGRCSHKVDPVPNLTQEHHDPSVELQGTEGPPQKKPTKDASFWMWSKEKAVRRAQNEVKTRMKTNNCPEEPRTQRPTQRHCQLELNKVLEELSKITFHDNREPLENLYELNFPNCDRRGQYNLKQCHMSTHGQRGECWCSNPITGVQITQSTKVRGDPNCSQYVEEQGMVTETLHTVVLQMAEI
ncbi:insulin-like growth factor-binding protein 2-B isoform X1 [Coregonus clupeaformis]|uniref:insulin-like growth factor-binding protein 2-B isoform X1 n=1 Tax=Coregonus clupeaformis TaxID=59861 RepID=UPI001BDFA2BB|nr:insulin-like growth factor-binding protein 2-B isoform X1 [Coregonus clupeaformis]